MLDLVRENHATIHSSRGMKMIWMAMAAMIK
jgi:hypothetical protein